MIKRLTPREQSIFIVTLVLGAFYLGYAFVINPMRENKEILESRIQSERIKLTKNMRLSAKLEPIAVIAKAYREKYGQTGSEERVMATMVKEIERSAGQLDLRISDLKPQRVQRNEYFNSFSVSLQLDSELPEILSLLQRLQSPEYGFDIDEIRLDKSSRRNSKTIKTRLVLRKVLVP